MIDLNRIHFDTKTLRKNIQSNRLFVSFFVVLLFFLAILLTLSQIYQRLIRTYVIPLDFASNHIDKIAHLRSLPLLVYQHVEQQRLQDQTHVVETLQRRAVMECMHQRLEARWHRWHE